MNETNANKNPNDRVEIAMVGPYPPQIGGTAAFLGRLVPALADKGVQCRVFNTMVGDPKAGVFERLQRLWFFLGLACRVARARERIVHCHAVNWANLLGHGFVMAAGRLTGKRTVLTLHAGNLLARFGADTPPRIARLLLGLPKVVTTVTPDLAAAAQRLTGKSVMFIANELAYTHESRDANGHDVPEYVREFVGGHQPVIVLVGAMDRVHGIDVLLRALKILRSDFADVGAILIAYKSVNAEYQKEIQTLIDREGLGRAVLIPDELPGVGGVLARADVFVRPTLSDGDSIAVREAIEAGVPVVASDTGYRPDGVTLFPPGDHEQLAATISRMLSSPQTVPVPAQASPDKTVDQYLEAYRLAAD
jgi:glycogen(starch) synthase